MVRFSYATTTPPDVTSRRPRQVPGGSAVSFGHRSAPFRCDKVPLLAPTGSVITLFATATTVPVERLDGDRRHGHRTGHHRRSHRRTAGHRRLRRTPTTSILDPAPALRCRTARSSPLRRRSDGLSRRSADQQRPGPGAVPRRRSERHRHDHRVLRRRVREARELQGRLGRRRAHAPEREPAGARLHRRHQPDRGARGRRQRRRTAGGPGDVHDDHGVSSIRRPRPPMRAATATTTLSTTQEAVVTANAAGKTATATVTISPRTGISVTAADRADLGGCRRPASRSTSSATANISNVTLDLRRRRRSRTSDRSAGSTTVPHTYEEAGHLYGHRDEPSMRRDAPSRSRPR